MSETARPPHPPPRREASRIFVAPLDGRQRLVQLFYLRPPAPDEEDEVPWDLLDGEFLFVQDGRPRPLTVKEADLPWTREEDHFRREILRLVRMQGRGFPTLLQAGVGHARGLLVFADPGETLADLVAREGPLDAGRVQRIAASLLDLLRPLHEQRPPFLVGEICPTRLSLDEHGQVRLLTLGEARLLFPHRQGDVGAWTSPYTAPERRQRAEESPASDLFSVGATLYFLASGCPPDARAEEIPPLDILCPGLDPRLARAINTSLAPQPQERFSSVAAFREALTGEHETEAPPHIQVDRTEIVELGVPRGSQRGGSITVSNSGGGRLSGSVLSSVPWLTVHPRHLEGDRVEVQYQINAEGLARGKRHTGTLRFGRPEAPDAPEIPVTLEVVDERKPSQGIDARRILRAVVPLLILMLLMGMSWAGITFSSLLEKIGLGRP